MLQTPAQPPPSRGRQTRAVPPAPVPTLPPPFPAVAEAVYEATDDVRCFSPFFM